MDYPRIGEKYRSSSKSGKCIFCGLPKADYRICVQITNMRGDDEVIKAHWNCIKGLRDSKLLEEILESWRK